MFEVSVVAYSRILGSSLYRTYASVGRVHDTLHVPVGLFVRKWLSETKVVILRVLYGRFFLHSAVSSLTTKRNINLKFRSHTLDMHVRACCIIQFRV